MATDPPRYIKKLRASLKKQVMPVEKAVFGKQHKQIKALISIEDETDIKSGETKLVDFGNLCPENAFDRKYQMAKLMAVLRRSSENLATVKSRLWHTSRRGETIDMKRSIARNILQGGNVLRLYNKERKTKKLKIVVVCDVSSSMIRHMKFVLPLFFGLSALKGRHETFVFANALERVTPIFGACRDIAQATDIFLSQTKQVGHGTDLSRSLNDMVESYPAQLTSSTLLVLISDGETLNPEATTESLRNVNRRVKGILWLNTQTKEKIKQNPLMSSYRKYCHIEECHNVQQLIKILRSL